MHNSQNDASMNLGKTFGIGSYDSECMDCHGANRARLLRMDCLGCHAQNIGGASNIVNPSNMPQVALATGSTPLAGGNYKYVFTNDSKGHNVHGFGDDIVTDDLLGNNPPGYNSSYDPANPDFDPDLYDDAEQIMCAGQNGCHGNRDEQHQILAIAGTHHADDTILRFGGGFTETGQGATVGTSYRFLYGVHGAEDNNWQASSSPTDHNEYRGDTFEVRSSQSSFSSIVTISQFCAECHGNFHASAGITAGSGSPWLRHPTDVLIPDSGEYASISTTYNVLTPVARQSIAVGTTQASPTVTPDEDIVMCLSCHMAHASNYLDILRWDYNNMASGTGCYVCHTQ
ncbi:MAG: hypothetical protein A2Y97_00005, partial [Nitrospirae bacterium RBG_13_39_12]